MAQSNFDQIFPLGEPNDAYAQYFTGQSYLIDFALPNQPCCCTASHDTRRRGFSQPCNFGDNAVGFD